MWLTGDLFLFLGCSAARVWPAHVEAIFPVAAFVRLVAGALTLRRARSGD